MIHRATREKKRTRRSMAGDRRTRPRRRHQNGTGFRRDPACGLSPHHAEILALAETESARVAPAFDYRRMARPVTVEA